MQLDIGLGFKDIGPAFSADINRSVANENIFINTLIPPGDFKIRWIPTSLPVEGTVTDYFALNDVRLSFTTTELLLANIMERIQNLERK